MSKLQGQAQVRVGKNPKKIVTAASRMFNTLVKARMSYVVGF